VSPAKIRAEAPADARRSIAGPARGRSSGRFWTWIDGLVARRPFNVVVAAVANKLARIIWAMLRRDQLYRAPA
jgi:uncharacterized membrane protein YdfJ with MMPL/SSD domain